jgi:8-oxo-dGTP pyrophosphatase MutT (NUDIX family)
MPQNIDKVAWIYIQNRKLLGARTKGKIPFYIPGGKREVGETDLETLVRELNEELSIEIDPNTATFTGEFQAQAHGKEEGVMVVMQCYEAGFKGDIAPTSEIEEIGWLTSVDITTDRCSYVDKVILKHLHEAGLVD